MIFMPAGYPSMGPHLKCKQAERLIGFPKDAFGGVRLRRFDRPE
jgi:PhnB protein